MRAFIKCSCAFANSVVTSYLGPNSLMCTKILSQRHPFLLILLSPSLSCKDTFMDDYDGIYNCNGLKYNLFEIFDNF
jgi:hypothetical protein